MTPNTPDLPALTYVPGRASVSDPVPSNVSDLSSDSLEDRTILSEQLTSAGSDTEADQEQASTSTGEFLFKHYIDKFARRKIHEKLLLKKNSSP